MTIIERVRERIESDLSTDELNALIDEATAEIIRRYGGSVPDQDSVEAEEAITVTLAGGTRSLYPMRAVTDDDSLEIVEIVSEDETTLDPDDYRVWFGGRRIERLSTGTNARSCWGDLVEVSYVPVDDSNQREEVVIKLVLLSITYQGLVRGDRAGDTSSTLASYESERKQLLQSLAPPLMA